MNDENKKKGMSTGAKWGIGCGIGCLTLIIIIAIAAFIGFRYVKGKVESITQELKQIGFEKEVKGQMLEVRDDITEPTIYIGQGVKILGNCKTDLAIIAQMAEIHGKVDGKVYFRGQVLVIQPKAELLNGLDVTAQVIQKHGKVNGKITGKYQAIDDDKTNQ
jgi:hypothetical protein